MTSSNPSTATLIVAAFMIIFYVLLGTGALAGAGALYITSSTLAAFIIGAAWLNTTLVLLAFLAVLVYFKQKDFDKVRTAVPTAPMIIGSSFVTLLLLLSNGFMINAALFAIAYFVMFFIRFNLVPKA